MDNEYLLPCKISLGWLLYRASLYFLKADNFDKAYELTTKNVDLAQRAACLVVGAQRLVKAKDTIRARQWLQEAKALITKAEPDKHWSRIAFGVAYTYGQFDNLMALESLSEAVKLLEKSPASLKDDENAPPIKRFSGLATLPDFTYGTTGFSLNAAVSTFKPDSFESVLYILNKIESPEARGMAVVTLCRKYLQPQPKGHAKLSDTPDGALSLSKLSLPHHKYGFTSAG